VRVNMDESIASGVRFKVVAETLGVPRTQVIGACFLVWLECYNRRSERLTIAEANAQAELPAFAEAMIEAGLAHAVDKSVDFHGVTERIEFLKAQALRGAKGGKHSRKQANAKPTLSEGSTKRLGTAKAYTLTQSLTPNRDQPDWPKRAWGQVCKAVSNGGRFTDLDDDVQVVAKPLWGKLLTMKAGDWALEKEFIARCKDGAEF